jgi:hypothetical protein
MEIKASECQNDAELIENFGGNARDMVNLFLGERIMLLSPNIVVECSQLLPIFYEFLISGLDKPQNIP